MITTSIRHSESKSIMYLVSLDDPSPDLSDTTENESPLPNFEVLDSFTLPLNRDQELLLKILNDQPFDHLLPKT